MTEGEPEALGFNRYPHWYGKSDVTLAEQLAEVRAKTGRRSLALAEYGPGRLDLREGLQLRQVEDRLRSADGASRSFGLRRDVDYGFCEIGGVV